jgi:DNA-binding response OmpR family regulator
MVINEATLRKFTALLIEDNMTIARQVVEFFEPHFWTVDLAHTGKLGIELAKQHIYDTVILDLNLPDIDGIEVCKAIKQQCSRQVPVLMLTARDSIDDKIKGLATGADDYLTKPFNLRELVLRCQSLSRRQHLHLSKVMQLGSFTLDTCAQKLSQNGQAINVTHIGFNLLLCLVKAHPSPVSRSDLMHAIWGDEPPQSDALKSHIYALRSALKKHNKHNLLVTMPQVGYRLDIKDNVC